jgi:hypothetical protein
MHFASIDFPDPGGPMIRTLWTAGDGDLDGALDVGLTFYITLKSTS